MNAFFLRQCPLDKLNSATKYPSILTYHTMGDRGVLQPELTGTPSGDITITEKVDGTNTRIILTPDLRWLIGSREDLLHADGDLIYNPAMGIVEAVKGIANDLLVNFKSWAGKTPALITVYGEVFGGRVGSNYKNYSKTGVTGFRVFDIAILPNFDEVLNWPIETIASWREHGGQQFLPVDRLIDICSQLNLGCVPVINTVNASELPTNIQETHSFLKSLIDNTFCKLDSDCNGQPEGVVIRNDDRTYIAKLRFEDYERTARKCK